MANKYDFYTNCVGRYVSGDLNELRTKDIDNRPIAEDKQQYEFGVAFPKTDPDIQRIFTEMHGFCMTEWASDPAKQQALNGWFQTMTGLSMKISDGDKPNRRGQINENTKGCYVFWFSSSYPIKTVDPHNSEIPAEAIKRGYYVQIAGSIVDNKQPYEPGPRNRAGVYMNPSVVRLVAEGEEIRGGVDAATAFGGTTAAQVQLPPGAKPVGTGAGMPGMGSTPGAAMPGATGNAQDTPAHNPSQPVQGQTTAPATMPGQASPQPGVQQPTASPGNAMPQPHTQILQGPGATQQPTTNMPGMPG